MNTYEDKKYLMRLSKMKKSELMTMVIDLEKELESTKDYYEEELFEAQTSSAVDKFNAKQVDRAQEIVAQIDTNYKRLSMGVLTLEEENEELIQRLIGLFI